MKSKIKIIIFIATIIFISAIEIYNHSELYTVRLIEDQINLLVKSKDISHIRKLADNNATQYILGLPKNSKCINTSFCQGLRNSNELYYVTLLDSHRLNIFIRRDANSNIMRKLFPYVKIIEIELYFQCVHNIIQKC